MPDIHSRLWPLCKKSEPRMWVRVRPKKLGFSVWTAHIHEVLRNEHRNSKLSPPMPHKFEVCPDVGASVVLEQSKGS